jgi:hypothetical protein
MTMRGSGFPGRAVLAVFGGLMVLGGLLTMTTSQGAASSGVVAVITGLVFIVVAVIERLRYRSEAAEVSGLPIGPGGGEPTSEPLDGRFRRTEEAFVDPTSGQRMRVWLDPASGERRYRAEG